MKRIQLSVDPLFKHVLDKAEKLQDLFINLGEVTYTISEYEKSIEKLKNVQHELKMEIDELQREYNQLISKIVEKYGNGQINIEEGVYEVEDVAES